MFIQTELTPNPATVKFIPGLPVMVQGTADFKNDEEAAASPLARALFSMSGVKGVFYGHDFISVTCEDPEQWSALKPRVLAAVMDHYTSGLPLLNEGYARVLGSDLTDEISKQIAELIDTRVRPAVAMDGGDIVFDRFEDGIVYLHMRGACAGCPSSTATLKHGIENMLRHFVPEVQVVRPAEEY